MQQQGPRHQKLSSHPLNMRVVYMFLTKKKGSKHMDDVIMCWPTNLRRKLLLKLLRLLAGHVAHELPSTKWIGGTVEVIFGQKSNLAALSPAFWVTTGLALLARIFFFPCVLKSQPFTLEEKCARRISIQLRTLSIKDGKCLRRGAILFGWKTLPCTWFKIFILAKKMEI